MLAPKSILLGRDPIIIIGPRKLIDSLELGSTRVNRVNRKKNKKISKEVMFRAVEAD
jgi:hypothetical protein